MQLIKCACGCGASRSPVDSRGRNRRYLPWHKGTRELTSQWAGGVKIAQGYVLLYQESIDGRPVYKQEHVLIAEKALGKPLPDGAVVHHHNEIKSDNRNCNLVICENQSYHQILHARARIVAAGGDPNTQKICYRCGSLFLVRKGMAPVCRPCASIVGKAWWANHKEEERLKRRKRNAKK